MKLAIMQPYFFPYLGYFQLINAVDKFILYDNLNYIKWGWVNRNRLVLNGQPTFFIVPIQGKSSFRKIRDIRVDTKNEVRWRKKILGSIISGYRKASFFDEIFPVLEEVVNTYTEYLSDLNNLTVKRIAQLLDISTEITSDVSNYEALEKELSTGASDIYTFYRREQNLSDTKTIRALQICKNEQADVFINAIGGQALYDKAIFKKNRIDLYFINTLPYSYKQSSEEFFPSMSIIDVLMNCGPTDTQRLLNHYELI
jgi:hypothetical protein